MIVTTSEQMKAIDRKAIEEYRIPGLILMEHAAMKVADVVMNMSFAEQIYVVCGTGNNGGDGFAAARLLYQKGKQVHVLVVGSVEKQSEDAKKMFRALLGLDIEIEYILGLDDLPEEPQGLNTIIIDALFGIGCSRALNGIHAGIVEWINESEGIVVSIDVPSGINSDNGHVMGVSVNADVTVTFTAPKVGIVVGPGKLAAGTLVVHEIGIPEAVLEKFSYQYELLDKKVLELLPKRAVDGHKTTFGKILIVAGSHTMSGAGIMAATAAYRAGSGLVEIITHENGLQSIQQAIPEAIVHTYGDTNEGYQVLEKISGRLEEFSGILVGPGITTSDFARDLLISVLCYARCPLVIDADGLNLLPALLPLVDQYQGPVILTPHIGEMSRLTGYSAAEILNNPCAFAESYSKSHGVITVLKSNATIITDGTDRYCINGMGNPGMATAGSGDVLSGVILSMIGQGAGAYRAAVLGVSIHSCAGDLMAKQIGERSLMASDIIDGLSEVLKDR